MQSVCSWLDPRPAHDGGLPRASTFAQFGWVACGPFDITTAFARSSQLDKTLPYYERYNTGHAPDRMFGDALNLAATHKALGKLKEARGNRAKAIENYDRFVGLWKNADPELQPVVRDVHARIAWLAAEH